MLTFNLMRCPAVQQASRAAGKTAAIGVRGFNEFDTSFRFVLTVEQIPTSSDGMEKGEVDNRRATEKEEEKDKEGEEEQAEAEKDKERE